MSDGTPSDLFRPENGMKMRGAGRLEAFTSGSRTSRNYRVLHPKPFRREQHSLVPSAPGTTGRLDRKIHSRRTRADREIDQ